MESDAEIQTALSKLRDGEATRRDAFSTLVGAGCSCLSAAELITEAAGESESGGAGARVAQGLAGASAGKLDAMAVPIFYSGFVVQKTTRCNAKCAMCYQFAGPRGSDLIGSAQLTFEEIARLIVEASGIDTISSRFHLSGGEAFLDVDGCVEIFRVARAAGFLDVMTTTNAYWAQAEERARDICLRLKEAGLTRMEISWDFWHLPYIRPVAVANCIRACRSLDIEVLLRVISSKSHSYGEALALLPDDALAEVDSVMCGPVLPTGRAAQAMDPDEFHGSSDLDANCHSFLNLTVGPTGEVSPCCAGLDHTEARLCGNIREQSLASIVAGMNASLLVRTLVFGGISRMRPILEQAGLPLGSDFRNICHMCWSVFSDRDRVRALNAHFAQLERRYLAGRVAHAMWSLTAGDA